MIGIRSARIVYLRFLKENSNFWTDLDSRIEILNYKISKSTFRLYKNMRINLSDTQERPLQRIVCGRLLGPLNS